MTGEMITRLLESLTRAEKLELVRGGRDPTGTATGYLPGVERLEIPPLRLVDGPLGVRIPGKSATAFPAPIAIGATFDPSAAYRKGAAMAREAAAREQDVLLAPGLNLIRVPHCGRNFEYYAEDPILTGSLYGDIDASGRLPVTFAPATDYPAMNPNSVPVSTGGQRTPRVSS